MLYEMKPHIVEAWELTWENWKVLTDLCQGALQQHLVVDQFAGTRDMHGWINLPNGQTVGIGNYLVQESHGGFISWTKREFELAFQAKQITDFSIEEQP